MDLERLRSYCKSFPHTTEQILWGNDLVFKVGGKMFAVAPTEPGPLCLSFKCSPDDFAELVELPGIVPAPYSARYHWVALESEEALKTAEVKRLLRKSYDLVFAGLPKSTQAKLAAPEGNSKKRQR